MSDTISVDFARLAQAETELSASQRVIDGSLSSLNGDLQPLFNSWQGDGGDAYTAQQNRWNQAAAELNATLLQIHQAVGVANSSYQANERKVTNAWLGV